MAKIQHFCPTCGKVAILKSEIKILKMHVRTYQCGHSESAMGTVAAATDTLDITSIDGKKPFPYQLEGGRFAEAADMRCLIADEMGLGKTIQAIMIGAAHPETKPFVAFVKAGLRMQWGKECLRWGGMMVQIIDGPNAFFLKGADGYIISQDSAWRIGYRLKTKKEKQADITERGDHSELVKIGLDCDEQLQKLGVKMVIIDECQQIKNGASKRAVAICKAVNNMKYVIALSGTPIKNNAAEYFTVLNLIRPDKFPNKNQFVYGWCDSYHNGYSMKTGGLKDPHAFLEYTKDFIIRRERKDVLPDLPLIFRQFSFCDLGEMVEDEYKKTMKEFQEYYEDEDSGESSITRQANILAFLSKMRHLTGLAKIDPVCDHVEEFITTTDRKIMLFVHHKDVGATLAAKLGKRAAEWPAEWGKGILQITSEMDMYARQQAVDDFASSDYRIMIGSTLASGEGLNLQFCSDMIMVERQWNPANEEQAEARFPRPGSTADKINAYYFVAVGTVDEFFSELVEQKREYVNSTLNGEAVKWDQSSLVQDLAKTLAQKGGQKWGF